MVDLKTQSSWFAFERLQGRVGQSMVVKRTDIRNLAKRIVREFKPERIILFGSYAHGHPDPDSDVDLLVVMPFEGRSSAKAVKILQRVKPRIPVDLLVRTPDEVDRRLAWNDFFLKEIMRTGEILYESSRA